MPVLLRQPVSDVIINALTASTASGGLVQLTGLMSADGFLDGLGVNSATSEELAAAALAEAGRMRWEPGTLRGIPVSTRVWLRIQTW